MDGDFGRNITAQTAQWMAITYKHHGQTFSAKRTFHQAAYLLRRGELRTAVINRGRTLIVAVFSEHAAKMANLILDKSPSAPHGLRFSVAPRPEF